MKIEDYVKIDKLRKQGYGYKKIASVLNLSPNTVKSYLRRDTEGTDEKSVCQFCGEKMAQIPHRKVKKFCSDRCRMAWWNSHQNEVKRTAFYRCTCRFCGAEFQSYGNCRRKYCSRTCYNAARKAGGQYNG